MGFGCGCDWWCEILLNGKIVFSTMKEGNNTPFVTYRNHTFTAKGKKGENLLVVRTLRGSEPEKTRFNSNVLYGAEKMTELPISFIPKEVEIWKQKNSQAGFGHGGSDSYMMHIFEETLLNGGTKAPCDLKAGLRMTLPGIFACRSAGTEEYRRKFSIHGIRNGRNSCRNTEISIIFPYLGLEKNLFAFFDALML